MCTPRVEFGDVESLTFVSLTWQQTQIFADHYYTSLMGSIMYPDVNHGISTSTFDIRWDIYYMDITMSNISNANAYMHSHFFLSNQYVIHMLSVQSI